MWLKPIFSDVSLHKFTLFCFFSSLADSKSCATVLIAFNLKPWIDPLCDAGFVQVVVKFYPSNPKCVAAERPRMNDFDAEQR